jgi:hypothetical protein
VPPDAVDDALMRWTEIIEAAAVGGADLLDEGGTITPVAPLTPEQARKRAARQARLQQQVRDEQSRHNAKVRDLRARMNNR